MFDNICEVLQIGLLKVPILLLDKTMGIFLRVIKDRTSINGIGPNWDIPPQFAIQSFICFTQKRCYESY
jgi:hypothetical protein